MGKCDSCRNRYDCEDTAESIEDCGDYEPNTPIKVGSVEELKKLASVEDGAEFFILLNHGVKSVKRVEWDKESQSFCILNQIDDTHQDLTEQELATETNIVKAIEKGAFYKS